MGGAFQLAASGDFHMAIDKAPIAVFAEEATAARVSLPLFRVRQAAVGRTLERQLLFRSKMIALDQKPSGVDLTDALCLLPSLPHCG